MDVLNRPRTRARSGLLARLDQTGRKLLVELIGTFFLVFTVGASVRSGSILAPVAIGSVLMAVIYAGGHISGGYVNPAVTMASLVRGRIGPGEAVGYWIVQLIAGALAALVVLAVISPGEATTLRLSGHLTGAFVAELLFTFALAYVVLNVTTSKGYPRNSFYGLAIGFIVLAGAVAVGGISGGAFNPAVALGGAVMGLFAWPTLWVYFVAELVAGAAAGLAFRAPNPNDKQHNSVLRNKCYRPSSGP
jgi:aquaporin Z